MDLLILASALAQTPAQAALDVQQAQELMPWPLPPCGLKRRPNQIGSYDRGFWLVDPSPTARVFSAAPLAHHSRRREQAQLPTCPTDP